MNLHVRRFYGVAVLLLGAVLLSGCAGTSMWPDEDGAAAETAPEMMQYAAVDFHDILLPNELEWQRDDSLSIRTDSFAGGTLKFTGMVEVNSLTDFFINTMTDNGWKLVGSVRYKNVLLTFTKPYKTCTITIFESKFSGNVSVYINTTDDIGAREGMGAYPGEMLK